jgi:hypothetical protein
VQSIKFHLLALYFYIITTFICRLLALYFYIITTFICCFFPHFALLMHTVNRMRRLCYAAVFVDHRRSALTSFVHYWFFNGVIIYSVYTNLDNVHAWLYLTDPS